MLLDSEVTDYFQSRPKDSQLAAYVSNQSEPISSEKVYLSKFVKSHFFVSKIVKKGFSCLNVTLFKDPSGR